MCSIAAVVFDLDDTLYAEREYAYSGFTAVAEAFADRLGDPRDSAARMRRLFDSEHRPRVFNALLTELGLNEELKLVEAMIEVYQAHRPTIRLHDDAEVILNKLRPKYRLGLLTDGRFSTQGLKIDALGLRDRFDAILITSELGPGFCKPSPRPFEFISTRLQVVGGRSVYVADNPAKDFLAPNALGWRTVQIRRAYGVYCDQKPAPGGEPYQVIETLDRLVCMIEQSSPAQ
jgi:putative hydrolase of the HAD superfamily